MAWGAFSFVLFIVAFAGLVALAQYRVDLFFTKFHGGRGVGGSVQDFGGAGEYFGFIVGVPVALLGAVIAAIASGLFAKYTSTRDEVAIFEYVAGIIGPVIQSMSRFIGSFADILGHGNRLFHFADKLMERANSKEQEKGEASDWEDWNRRVSAALADLPEDEKKTLELSLTGIGAELENWKKEYENLTATLYGGMLARERINLVLSQRGRETALAYLHRSIPKELHDRLNLNDHTPPPNMNERRRRKAERKDTNDHTSDVVNLIGDLILYHKKTELNDAVRAMTLLPNYLSTLKFLGAVIYSPLLILSKPTKHGWPGRRLVIDGYFVNVGGAILLTLFKYIPEKEALLSMFGKIFDDRSIVARNFVRDACPSLRDFVSSGAVESIAREEDALSQLIVVLTSEGPEYYDENKHGPIPVSGYD